MKNKFHLTREQNIFIARRNIVDYIWKSANLEGIKITYPQTQVLYNGGVINGLTASEIVAINNLKRAWQFILDNELKYEFSVLSKIHEIVMNGLVSNVGVIRTVPVNIGGTNWKPGFPIESQIKEELEEIINSEEKSKTEISLDVMLYIMKKQMFLDGNKRVAMLFANLIMINAGAGIISIKNSLQSEFYEKLIAYYENNDSTNLKKWLYINCIDGIDL